MKRFCLEEEERRTPFEMGITMLSLGSAGIVNQAMNGLILVYSRALVQGDVVKIDDEKGVVTNVGLLSSKIKTCRSEKSPYRTPW